MNRILLTRLVPLLMMVWLPLSMPAVKTIIYNATYDFGKMTTGTDTLGGVTYTTVNYDGMFNSGEPGMPSLPVDYIKLSVPYNATNFTVTATLQNNTISNLNSYLVYPCQPSRMMNDTTPIVIIPPDASVYNSGSYYPSRNAWVVDEGFLAGENHIVTVAVMPVSYRHRALGSVTTNQLRESQTVRIVLSYDLTDTPSMCPIIRQDSTLRQEGYALTQSMVANPDNVISFAPTQMDMDPLDPNGLITGNELNGGVEPPDPGSISHDTIAHYGGELELPRKYAYLIVTTPELKHSLRRLVALKRQKGYGVKIATMDDVMSDSVAKLGDYAQNRLGNYEFAYTDSAGSLRQYLKKVHKQNDIEYVLFAGQVPYRYAYVRYGFSLQDSLPSDLYFGDLNGFWSTNIYKEKIDFNPELFVGRILANKDKDINNYTNKLLKYELNPGGGDLNYLKRILYSICTDFQKEGPPRNYNKVFDVDTTFCEDTINRTPCGTDLVNCINNTKIGYVSLLNHAGPSGIITSCKHPAYYLWAIDTIHLIYNNQISSDPHIFNGLNNINNKDYPFICYSIGCTTMPFDKAPHYENVPINCGESFTIGKNYGGPAFLGNTRAGRIGGAERLEGIFALLLSTGTTHIGMTEAMSKALYTTDFYTCGVHNLLGDPEFEIWTDIPQRYNNINITRTDSSLTVTGINMDSTIVSYCDNAGGIRKKTVSSSVTLKNISPNGSLMLYRQNSIPYIAPMVLQNVTLNNSQYVLASDFTAGESIDSNRTNGDVIVKNGVNYEIEASGTTTLQDGFKVETGATFSVIPSTF